MNFIGAAKRLEDIDLPRIASTIGVGEDELHAFMDVEAAGAGFDAKGRPKMLFEPHIFYRLLGPGKARDKAVKLGVAYAKWKPKGYPKESYTRLSKAMEINATIALMSASWGAAQIMGFNHGSAGYATPEQMVQDFMADEDNHIEAMVRFLVNKKLDDDLRAHRWRVIEEVYNGGGYGGAYARRMEKAFAKWQKIKDTPYQTDSDAYEQSYRDAVVMREEIKKTDKAGKAAGSAVVVGTGSAAVAVSQGVPWQMVLLIGGIALFIAFIVFVIMKNRSA